MYFRIINVVRFFAADNLMVAASLTYETAVTDVIETSQKMLCQLKKPSLFGVELNIKKLSSVLFNSSKSCPCCTKQFRNGINLILLDCGHVYCFTCKSLLSSCLICNQKSIKFLKINQTGTGFTALGAVEAQSVTVGMKLDHQC